MYANDGWRRERAVSILINRIGLCSNISCIDCPLHASTWVSGPYRMDICNTIVLLRDRYDLNDATGHGCNFRLRWLFALLMSIRAIKWPQSRDR